MKTTPAALSALACIPMILPAAADDALDPLNASVGVGAEISSFNRDISLVDNSGTLDVDTDGPMAGVHGHIQSGPLLRGDFRVATGDADVETSIGDTDERMDFAEARGTLGTELNEGRLYAGLGVAYYTVDFDDLGIDWNTTSLYVPVGYAKSNSVADNWTARTRFEGRLAVAGEEELEGLPVIGNATFDHDTGFGARIEFVFRNKHSGLEIGAFAETLEPGDTDDELGVEAEDINNTSAGITAGVSF